LKIDRRALIKGGAVAGLVAAACPAWAQEFVVAPAPAPVPSTPSVDPGLLARAKAALELHRSTIPYTDVIAITDFAKASRDPRFYLVNMNQGWVTEHHVAHGRGSDPDHSGWLERFSNEVGSEASSNGAFVTGDLYYGKHGLSMRLDGLDPTNNNAFDRAIVVHAAWYAEPKLIDTYGKLGRSEGCFAFSDANMQYILAQLGPGRMIYADKIA
jgi:L,D-transpeptidase-like protein